MTNSPAVFQPKKRELGNSKLRKKCSISGGAPLRIRELSSHLRDIDLRSASIRVKLHNSNFVSKQDEDDNVAPE
eukprot:1131223-Amphidinium_carterae.1